MPSKPVKISVIIPTFNEENFLPYCLKSLNQQDYPKQFIEIIVVDNGSTDKTREIARDHGAIVYQNDEKTVAGLRNLGVQHATGEIIAFIDADCVAASDWIKSASDYFHSDLASAWGSSPGIPDKATWVQRTWYLVRNKYSSVQEVDWLESMNLFVPKKLFEAVNGFNESLITCEDVDLSYRLSKLGKIICDNRIKVIHSGEAANLREFYKKELWRGKGNFQGVLSHGLLLRELPGLLVPFYFGILIPIALVSMILKYNIISLSVFLLLSVFPISGVIIKVIKRNKRIRFLDIIRLSLLLEIYFWARTLAITVRSTH